jgi:hypothetical protein
MIELAYLRAFLAWESFLEESFILYMLGKKPPRGSGARRYALPPNRQLAHEFAAEGAAYARWEAPKVTARANKFFENGYPFTPALAGHQAALEQATTIRNAIAHGTANTQLKFEKLARDKLGSLPSGMTVGVFLDTAIPNESPPRSFFEFYLEEIEAIANRIVPS